jgi:site-specific DNA recombinase
MTAPTNRSASTARSRRITAGGTRKRATAPALFGADAERELRVAWYRRASTDEANQPYSLDAQEQRLSAYTQAQPGWTFVGDYVERASAKDVEGRPQLQRLLDDAAADKFDLVLVARLDRWSRNLVDCLDTVDFLTEHGVAFHSASEHFDTSTPTGVLLLQMLGMFAQFERATIIDRIQKGNAAKLAKGLPLTGRVGYGLRVTDKGKLKEDPATIGVVRRIFDEYVNHKHGAKTIAASLNEDGIPTGGKAAWSADGVLRVLRNRAFVGEVRGQNRWHPGAHKPILDEDLFDAAQDLASKRSVPAAAAATNSDFILSGTITCARCGGSYVGTRGTSSSKAVHRYYSCVTARRYGAKKCDGPSLPADELEDLVITALLGSYADHGLFSDAVQLHLERRAEKDGSLIEQLEAQRAAIEAKTRVRNKYQDDYERGALSAERYEARAAELDDDLAALAAHQSDLELMLSAEPPPVPDADELAALHALLCERMRSGNHELRKGVCSALIESLVVHDRDDIAPTFRLLLPGAAVGAVDAPEQAAAGLRQRGRRPGVAANGAAFAHGGTGWSQGDSNP